jgi:hypothetical protein
MSPAVTFGSECTYLHARAVHSGWVLLVFVRFVTVAACGPVPLSFCLGVLVAVFSVRVSLCVCFGALGLVLFSVLGLVWLQGLFVGLRLLFGGGKAQG